MFALSHRMGKCMTNFPLASYLFHIANFISHGEMHEEFPIRLCFWPFIYQLSHPMKKCMKNFSSYLYKIIGVCSHILDLVIRDWLEQHNSRPHLTSCWHQKSSKFISIGHVGVSLANHHWV